MDKYPINFRKQIEGEPQYLALRRVLHGKLGQRVLRDIGAGMSPKAFDDYKVSMGKDFEKALEAIKTQDARSDEAHLKKYAELVWLFNLHKDDIDWRRYPCLFKDSPCFLCPHRSCGKSAPDVVLELLEREHCRQIHRKEGLATDRHCPLHQG